MNLFDNSKLQQEIKYLFENGDRRWNLGITVQEKKSAFDRFYMQGLKLIQQWIDRETNAQTKENIQLLFNDRYSEVKYKLSQLEQIKQQVNQPQLLVVGGETKSNIQGGGGGGNNNNNSQQDKDNDKIKSAVSEAIVTTKPNIKWSDIAGLEVAKGLLQEAVILPIKFPKIFEGAREPWKGILLYGPPGTGKTFLAKACATETDATFISVSAADLVSKYVGETEKTIKALFNIAREKKPSIIFIDECDSMFGARGDGENEASRRAKTEFLTQMQGVGRDDQGILVLGATNLPQALDPAIRRRFQKRIYIPLPEEQARLFMIKHNLQKIEHNITEDEFIQFSKICDGYSGSDISIVMKDALYAPVRKLQKAKKFKKIIVDQKVKFIPCEDYEQGPDIEQKHYLSLKQEELEMPKITKIDVEQSFKSNKPSVSKNQLIEYEKFTKEFGQDG